MHLYYPLKPQGVGDTPLKMSNNEIEQKENLATKKRSNRNLSNRKLSNRKLSNRKTKLQVIDKFGCYICLRFFEK